MSTDGKIGADLAVVARASRSRPVPLASTLRAIGAGEQRSASSVPLLASAAAYANRLAGLVAGTWMLAITTVVVALMFVPRDADDVTESILDVQYATHTVSAAASVFLSSALLYTFVWAWAAKRFENAIAGRDPFRRGRRLVEALERSSTTLLVAGTCAFVMTFGLFHVAIGSNYDLNVLRPPGVLDYASRPYHAQSWVMIAAGAVLASVAASIFIVRVRNIDSWVGIVCAVVFGVLVFIGLDSPWSSDFMFSDELFESTTERAVLTIIGFVSLLGLAGAIVSSRRRREIAALDGE